MGATQRLSQNFKGTDLAGRKEKKERKKKLGSSIDALRRLHADGIHECAQVANRIVNTRAKLVGFRANEPRFQADEPNSLPSSLSSPL